MEMAAASASDSCIFDFQMIAGETHTHTSMAIPSFNFSASTPKPTNAQEIKNPLCRIIKNLFVIPFLPSSPRLSHHYNPPSPTIPHNHDHSPIRTHKSVTISLSKTQQIPPHSLPSPYASFEGENLSKGKQNRIKWSHLATPDLFNPQPSIDNSETSSTASINEERKNFMLGQGVFGSSIGQTPAGRHKPPGQFPPTNWCSLVSSPPFKKLLSKRFLELAYFRTPFVIDSYPLGAPVALDRGSFP